MTDNVTQMHQPLTQQDWGFIFDVLDGTKLDVPRIRSEVARLQREAAKSERRAITFGDIVAQQVMAMRAAYVDAKLNGSDAGMAWIENTLEGPGHLPDLAAAKKEGGAQCMFNREMAEHEASFQRDADILSSALLSSEDSPT